MLACAGQQAAAPAFTESSPRTDVDGVSAPPHTPPTTREITVLTTNDPDTRYCDGARMDSEGYRRTLTVEKPLRLPPEGAKDSEVVRTVVEAVTTGSCRTAMSQLAIAIEQGAVIVPPVDGWAGMSIAMCKCKPELDVNLVRIPGVRRVVWATEAP